MRLHPSDSTLHMLRTTLLTVGVSLATVAVVLLQRMPASDSAVWDSVPLPFGSGKSSLLGALTDIGAKSGKIVTLISFDGTETGETLPVDHLNIILLPDTDDISSGAPLSLAITPMKRVFGYKYSSRNAEEERAARARAENGEPLLFPDLFPGQFFASDAAGDFIPDFGGKNTITFLPLSEVTLDRNARYVIVTADAGTVFTARGIVICGDGKTSGWEECDDGNTFDTDACTNFCRHAVCSDGFHQRYGADGIDGTADDEECDDGNTFDTDACTNSCRISCGNGIFAPVQEYAPGENPYPITFSLQNDAVAFGDLNGDGIPDKTTVNVNFKVVSVHLGYGNGRFSAPTDYTTHEHTPTAVATGDLNGDGHADIAVAHGPNNNISVFFGNGTGKVTMHGLKFPTGDNPESITVADVDEDGDMDMVTANRRGKTVSVILGRGMGTFAVKKDYVLSVLPTFIRFADLDGDGVSDMISVNLGNSLSVFRGNGDGTFGNAVSYRTGYNTVAIHVADLNDDGFTDIVTLDTQGGTAVLLGKAAGCP